MRPPLPRRAAIAIVVLALAVRLAAGFWWQERLPAGQRFFFGDSATYWALGECIAEGRPYEYGPAEARVFRAPGYPLVLASMFALVGTSAPVMWARALSALLGAATVTLVILWANWLFDPRTGLIAGAMAALYPGAVAMGTFVLSEAAFCPLMIGQLWLWGAAARSTSRRQRLLLAGGGGLVAGLATLVRPSWLLFTPFAWLISVAFTHPRRQQLVAGLVALLVMSATMTPWWVRNYQVVGHFVPTTLQVGASLYDGLNPTATGASDMRFDAEMRSQLQADDALHAPADDEPFEYRLDRKLARDAVAWAQNHPGRVVELAAIKLLRLWNVWPNEPQFRGWLMRSVVLITYAPLLLAGIWGIWKFSPAGWQYVLAWLPAIYLTLLHTIFVSSIRYREPAMVALIVLAAGALGRCCRGTKLATATSAA